MNTFLIIKNFAQKKKFWIIFVLFWLSFTCIAAIDYTITTFGTNIQENEFHNHPLNFHYQTTNYKKTHPVLKSFIEESFFEIKAELTVDTFMVMEGNLRFSYFSEEGNITERDEILKMNFLGLNKELYNRLQQPEYHSIISLPYSWEEFSGHWALFFSYNLFYSDLMTNMTVEIPNDRTVQITNRPSTNILNDTQDNSTRENDYSTYLSGIKVLDSEALYRFLGKGFSSYLISVKTFNPLIIGDEEVIRSLFQDYECKSKRNFNLWYYMGDITLIQQDYFNDHDLTDILMEFSRVESNYRDSLDPFSYLGPSPNPIIEEIFLFYASLYNVPVDIFEFQIWALLFYLPILFLSYRFIKSAFKSLIEQEQQEMGLFLINGVQKKHLKWISIGFFLGMGIIGGIFGSFSGLLVANWIGKSLFPHINFSLGQIYHYFHSQLGRNIIIYGLIAIVFTLKACRKPIANLLKYKNANRSEEQAPKFQVYHRNNRLNHFIRGNLQLKTDLLIFIGGLLTIGISLYLLYGNAISIRPRLDGLDINNEDLLWFQLPLMPLIIFFPLLFPHALIRTLFSHIPSLIKRIKHQFSFKPKKKKHNKRNIRSQQRFRMKMLVWGYKTKKTQYLTNLQSLVFALIMIMIFMTLNHSYLYTKTVYDSTIRANGELVDLFLLEPADLNNLTSNVLDLERNLEKNVGCSGINTFYFSKYVDRNYGNDANIRFLDYPLESFLNNFRLVTTNFSKIIENTVLRDDWFIGGSAKELLTRLSTDPDAILLPLRMFKNNYTIGAEINFRYPTVENVLVQKCGTIIGAYKMFPGINQYHVDWLDREGRSVFLSPLLMDTVIISVTEFVIYQDRPLTPSQFTQFNIQCQQAFPQKFISNIVDIEDDYAITDEYYFALLKISNLMIIIFSGIGVLINSLIIYSRKKNELGIMRARGYRKTDLLKLSLYENGIFGFIALMFSGIGLLGSQMYILFFNFSEIRGHDDKFLFYFRPNYFGFLLLLVIGITFFIGIHIFLSLHHIKQTDSKKKLEKILRYRE